MEPRWWPARPVARPEALESRGRASGGGDGAQGPCWGTPSMEGAPQNSTSSHGEAPSCHCQIFVRPRPRQPSQRLPSASERDPQVNTFRQQRVSKAALGLPLPGGCSGPWQGRRGAEARRRQPTCAHTPSQLIHTELGPGWPLVFLVPAGSKLVPESRTQNSLHVDGPAEPPASVPAC